MSVDIQALSDQIDIGNLLTRYCRAVDSKDWDLYRSLLTDDAHLDYSAAGLFVGGPDDAVEYLTGRQDSISVGMHYATNVECDITGDTATVRAMFYNPMQLPGRVDQSCCGGYYHHELVRTADRWRSRNLREDSVWFTGEP